MKPNFNFQVLDETKTYIQQLEASNASLEERLAALQSELTASKREREAVNLSKSIATVNSTDTRRLMDCVYNGEIYFEIMDGLDRPACACFVILRDDEVSKSTLKVKFTSVKRSDVFIERTIKVKYGSNNVLDDLKPEDIFILQGGWKINGVYDLTIWTYDDYIKRNNRDFIRVNRHPVKRAKIDQLDPK